MSALLAEGDPKRPKLLAGWNFGIVPRHYRDHATILLEYVGRHTPPPWHGRVVGRAQSHLVTLGEQVSEVCLATGDSSTLQHLSANLIGKMEPAESFKIFG